jgi:hypothetical protein
VRKTALSYWLRHFKHVFKSVIIVDRGATFSNYQADRCWVINFLRIPLTPKEERTIFFAAHLVSTLSTSILMRGRSGYFGAKHFRLISIRAEIRFLRKCISPQNHLEVLSAISQCYKIIDTLQPNKHYYNRFILFELKKWSFGKNLNVDSSNKVQIVE